MIVGRQNLEMAAVVGVFLVLPSILVFLIQRHLLKGGAGEASIGSSAGGQNIPLNPGLKAACLAASVVVVALIVVLFSFVVAGACVSVLGVNNTFTLEHFATRRGWSYIQNSLVVSLGAAFVAAALGVLQGYVLVFHGPPLNLTGTMLILVLNMAFCNVGVAMTAAINKLHQIDTAFEEASADLGAGPVRTFGQVAVPLLLPAFMAGFVYTFMTTMVTVRPVPGSGGAPPLRSLPLTAARVDDYARAQAERMRARDPDDPRPDGNHAARKGRCAMPAIGTSDDVVLAVGLTLAVLLVLAGAAERRRHRRRLARISMRVSVNGSRGKSTVTRLLAGSLAGAGYRPLAKTTGTEPRLLHAWTGEEQAVHRRPEGPNIGEQRDVVRQAVGHGADSVVVECMAVTPEYQETFHTDLVDPNVLLVTSVLEDHLDVMGPTVEDVAEVFADTVPRGGVVVVTPGPHVGRFHATAEQRGATFLMAHPAEVEPADLRGFDHLVFPEHVALVLALCHHLGIPRQRALDGMRAAPPDPFATRLLPVGDRSAPAVFVNAFPANDPASARGIWEHVREQGYPEEKLVVIMNCRGDRVPRTQQFAEEVLPTLPIDTLVVVGEETQPVVRAAERGSIELRELRDATGQDPHETVAALDDELRDRVVLGVGNLHGAGLGVVEAFEQRRVSEGDA